MIHVCSLARLHDTIAETGARHVVTLLGDEDRLIRPLGVPRENHLWLRMHDIADPAEGFVMPSAQHITDLIAFVSAWDRAAPLIVHCWAGISRSTASAFTAACALNPHRAEDAIAQAIRKSSPTAAPNRRIVTLADEMLGRGGRMVAAVTAIGAGIAATEGVPFRLDLE